MHNSLGSSLKLITLQWQKRRKNSVPIHEDLLQDPPQSQYFGLQLPSVTQLMANNCSTSRYHSSYSWNNRIRLDGQSVLVKSVYFYWKENLIEQRVFVILDFTASQYSLQLMPIGVEQEWKCGCCSFVIQVDFLKLSGWCLRENSCINHTLGLILCGIFLCSYKLFLWG